jgi:hypothetical protein
MFYRMAMPVVVAAVCKLSLNAKRCWKPEPEERPSFEEAELQLLALFSAADVGRNGMSLVAAGMGHAAAI